MKTKTVLIISVMCIIIASVFFAIGFFSDSNQLETKQIVIVDKPQHETVTFTKKDTQQHPTEKLKNEKKSTTIQSSNPETETEPVEEVETVDSLKELITDIAVEYIEDVPLLDELVQESASEPEDLWEGEWVSIDDWKRNNDSFTVEKNEDGAFELIPDKDSTQSYSYNEETKEFEWVLDYYGKKITHKAKFLSEDVMVLMKISGIKVALDIYKRDAG